MKYDFVAIGDITTDCFIKLKDAEELMDHGTRELCVRFADKVPFEEATEVRAVGNAANAAVAAQRIGLSSALIARVGDDQNGKNCRETLRGNGVSDEYVETQAGLPTNYHYVLWFGAERTILVKQTKFTYSMPQFETPPKYIYLTSLGESAKEFHHEIAAYCREHPETKLAFQPGTFQIKLGAEELKDLYAVTEIFFCNKEEAQTILKTAEADVKKLMEKNTTIQSGNPEKLTSYKRLRTNVVVNDNSHLRISRWWHEPELRSIHKNRAVLRTICVL